jgi:hypothetical protein
MFIWLRSTRHERRLVLPRYGERAFEICLRFFCLPARATSPRARSADIGALPVSPIAAPGLARGWWRRPAAAPIALRRLPRPDPSRRTRAAQWGARKLSVLLGLSAGRPIRAMIEKDAPALRTFKACGTVYPPISPHIADRLNAADRGGGRITSDNRSDHRCRRIHVAR